MAPKNPTSGTCSKDSRLLILEGTGGGTGLANDDLRDDKEAVSGGWERIRGAFGLFLKT